MNEQVQKVTKPIAHGPNCKMPELKSAEATRSQMAKTRIGQGPTKGSRNTAVGVVECHTGVAKGLMCVCFFLQPHDSFYSVGRLALSMWIGSHTAIH